MSDPETFGYEGAPKPEDFGISEEEMAEAREDLQRRILQTADEPQPFWEITITLESQLDHDAVFEAVEELLHDMGEIGTLASQKWHPLRSTTDQRD